MTSSRSPRSSGHVRRTAGVVAGLLVAAGAFVLSPSVPVNAAADGYTAVAPARLLDTRVGSSTIDGQFRASGSRPTGSVLQLQITGRGGIPASGVSSVALNLTAVTPNEYGFITAWPCDVPMPTASSLNYSPGDVVGNSAIVKLDSNGRVCLYNHGRTDLVADVNGWFSTAATYSPLTPSRVIDTRPGAATADAQFQGIGPRAAGSTTKLSIAGRGGVPAVGAQSVVINVTSTEALEPGFITVYPCDESRPNASNLNFVPGTNRANGVIAKLAADGSVCIYTLSAVHIVADVNGWDVTDGSVRILSPRRLLDTRPGASTIDSQHLGAGQRPSTSVYELDVTGRGGVPASGVGAVALNVTAVGGEDGFITVYPCATHLPVASSVNYKVGGIAPNSVIARVGEGGKVCLYSYGAAHLVVDVSGWVPGNPAARTTDPIGGAPALPPGPNPNQDLRQSRCVTGSGGYWGVVFFFRNAPNLNVVAHQSPLLLTYGNEIGYWYNGWFNRITRSDCQF